MLADIPPGAVGTRRLFYDLSTSSQCRDTMASQTRGAYPADSDTFLQFPSRRSVVHSTKGIVSTTSPLASEAGLQILRHGGNAAVRESRSYTFPPHLVKNIDVPCVTGRSSCRGRRIECRRSIYDRNRGRRILSILRSRDEESARSQWFRKVVCSGKSGRYMWRSSNHGPSIWRHTEHIYPLSDRTRSCCCLGRYRREVWIGQDKHERHSSTSNTNGQKRISRKRIIELLCMSDLVPMWAKGMGTNVFPDKWIRSEQELRSKPNGADLLKKDSSAPEGVRAPSAGEIMKNPLLAKTFETLAEKGKSGFYEGPVAEAIVHISRQLGGHMNLADLQEHTSEIVEPVALELTFPPDDSTIKLWEHPPNGQGIVAQLALGILSELEKDGRVPSFSDKDHNSALYVSQDNA